MSFMDPKFGLECEIGHKENAEILTRTLFEGLLAIRFILHRPKRLDACTPGLRGARRKLPRLPSNRRAVDIRALLYAAMPLLQIHRLRTQNLAVLAEVSAEMAQAIKEAKKEIGSIWYRVLTTGRRTYSGLSVKDLAETYRLEAYYERAYGIQSTAVHANDPLRFVRFDRGTIYLQLAGNIDDIPMAMHLAAGVLGLMFRDITRAFDLRLESKLEAMASLWQERAVRGESEA